MDEKKTRETTTIYVRSFPIPLARQFKSILAANGETMRDRIIKLIEDYLKKEEWL